MSATAPRPQAIAVSYDNEAEWTGLAERLSQEGGAPTQLTADAVGQMLGGAVALLFAADAARDYDLLRGTFQDPVVAQCQRNAGCLEAQTPVSATVHLIGSPPNTGHPTLRTHLALRTTRTDGQEGHVGQSWDLQCDAMTTVGQASCPNCGAPIPGGALICGHCGHDVRSVVTAPLSVSRLEIY